MVYQKTSQNPVRATPTLKATGSTPAGCTKSQKPSCAAFWLCTGRFFIKILPGNPPILSQLGIFIFPPHLEGRISTRLRRIFLGNIEPLIDKALGLQCVFVDKYLPVRTRNRLGTVDPCPLHFLHLRPIFLDRNPSIDCRAIDFFPTNPRSNRRLLSVDMKNLVRTESIEPERLKRRHAGRAHPR